MMEKCIRICNCELLQRKVPVNEMLNSIERLLLNFLNYVLLLLLFNSSINVFLCFFFVNLYNFSVIIST